MKKRKLHPPIETTWTGEQIIPRKIHSLWIGDRPAPMKWINTWKTMNPDWEHTLWGNEAVFSRKWKNQEMIDFYLKDTKRDTLKLHNGVIIRGDKAKYFQWHVIADVLRYEILYEQGGYMPGADSECLRSINDKFGGEAIYTVNTGCLYLKEHGRAMEEWKKKRFAPENASPILASIPGHPFLKKILEELPKREWGEAVDTTGNVFMGDMFREYGVPDDMRIINYVKRAQRRNPHSLHYAGTTTGTYKRGV